MYDGSHFFGYQVQPNKRTVQLEIERALTTLHKGESIRIHASGRTDAGVHAKGQVIHFDSPLSIPEEKWPKALNALLPTDVVVQKVEKAEASFHARFDAVGKQYRYFVYQGKTRDPFKHSYQYYYPFFLNKEAMEEAAPFLLGTHDFTSFCSAKTEVEDKVRELTKLELIEVEEGFIFCFEGNGFLYNMVRILVGTLLQVGAGELEPKAMEEILAKKDRGAAGKTAPPHGLYLWEVHYENQ
jgi:tRNA pseudouridine38-40 synthase